MTSSAVQQRTQQHDIQQPPYSAAYLCVCIEVTYFSKGRHCTIWITWTKCVLCTAHHSFAFMCSRCSANDGNCSFNLYLLHWTQLIKTTCSKWLSSCGGDCHKSGIWGWHMFIGSVGKWFRLSEYRFSWDHCLHTCGHCIVVACTHGNCCVCGACRPRFQLTGSPTQSPTSHTTASTASSVPRSAGAACGKNGNDRNSLVLRWPGPLFGKVCNCYGESVSCPETEHIICCRQYSVS